MAKPQFGDIVFSDILVREEGPRANDESLCVVRLDDFNGKFWKGCYCGFCKIKKLPKSEFWSYFHFFSLFQ